VKVILFGATGMVGQGVLRECLGDPRVEAVLSVGRSATGETHPKLKEIIRSDFSALSDSSVLGAEFSGHDACFFCLGTTAATLDLARYRSITYDMTLAVAKALAARAPQMVFVYVSAAGANANPRNPIPWTRIKGEIEGALLRLPFRKAVMLRPGLIRPLHGIRSRTRAHRIFYAVFGPVLPLLGKLLPGVVTNTEAVGRAMIRIAVAGYPKAALETADINALSRAG
jgi:uncharacterized protein YbjT (DUF2867 family)